MNDLEHRLIHLVTEFRKLKAENEELRQAMGSRDIEIGKLRKTIAALQKSESSSTAERYRLRHLETERKKLAKKLNVLLKKLRSLEEILEYDS
ncbi:MAG: hypothetical protein CSA81_06760 [Acidobacteria bacterium]|nr:MAG: hypothetical protein CSA81_06760 [Acidobacteriota bacterium]PIE90631.1 MAG: hypothetical protein CR997_05170 [Acidobacteriota bacterium]